MLQAQEAYKKACLAFEAKEAHLQSLISRREAATMVLLMPPAAAQRAPASNGPDPGNVRPDSAAGRSEEAGNGQPSQGCAAPCVCAGCVNLFGSRAAGLSERASM